MQKGKKLWYCSISKFNRKHFHLAFFVRFFLKFRKVKFSKNTNWLSIFFVLDCKRNVSKSMYPKNVQETSLDVFLTFVCVDRVWGALIYFLRDSHWLTCTLMNKWKETTWVAAVIFRHTSSEGDRKIFKPCFINWWPHHEWKKVKLFRALKI